MAGPDNRPPLVTSNIIGFYSGKLTWVPSWKGLSLQGQGQLLERQGQGLGCQGQGFLICPQGHTKAKD